MLLFCPACGNVLVAEEGPRCHRFACTTCPYLRNVTRKVPGRGGLAGEPPCPVLCAWGPVPLALSVPAAPVTVAPSRR